MITDRSIQEVRERADLLDIVRKYVPELKKRGSTWSGPCPFHDEKTPSFAVNPVKNIYKCFGCGAGGHDGIKFLMEKENMDFITAIKYLANWFNITLEETAREEVPAEVVLQKADYLKINKGAAAKYQKNMLDQKLHPEGNPVIQEILYDRALSNDSIIDFQIGYAPDEWRFLSMALVEKGLFKPAEELGLVATKNATNYDMYRNRIIFPIHNERGEVIGFGGRKMEDDNKDNPKYINSKESPLYKKDKVLYGLYQAATAIRKMKFVVVVEGYYDVISFHQAGMANTVAPCGTALTDNHAKLLKRYTEHVILMGDGDKAGQKANLKAVDVLLKYGFKVEICTLPEKHDPDSFARSLPAAEVLEETE